MCVLTLLDSLYMVACFVLMCLPEAMSFLCCDTRNLIYKGLIKRSFLPSTGETLANQIAFCLSFQGEYCTNLRRTVMRYVNLSNILVLRQISSRYAHHSLKLSHIFVIITHCQGCLDNQYSDQENCMEQEKRMDWVD